MAEKKPLLQFTVAMIKHNGKDTMLLRKLFQDPSVIKLVCLEVIKNGKFEFSGELIFTNRFKAMVRLKELGLLKI